MDWSAVLGDSPDFTGSNSPASRDSRQTEMALLDCFRSTVFRAEFMDGGSLVSFQNAGIQQDIMTFGVFAQPLQCPRLTSRNDTFSHDHHVSLDGLQYLHQCEIPPCRGGAGGAVMDFSTKPLGGAGVCVAQAMAARLAVMEATRTCVRIVVVARIPPRIRVVSAKPPRPVTSQHVLDANAGLRKLLLPEFDPFLAALDTRMDAANRRILAPWIARWSTLEESGIDAPESREHFRSRGRHAVGAGCRRPKPISAEPELLFSQVDPGSDHDHLV